MVGTIGLAGCGPGDRRPSKEQLVLAGATAASATVSLGAVGVITARLPWHSVFLPLVWVTAAMLVMELAAGRARFLPTLKRQVSAGTYLLHPMPRVALLWGVEQGAFVLTVMNTWGYWTMVALVAASASPTLGMVGGLVAGLTRGSQVPWTTIIAGAGSQRPTIASVAATRSRGARVALAAATLATVLLMTIPQGG